MTAVVDPSSEESRTAPTAAHESPVAAHEAPAHLPTLAQVWSVAGTVVAPATLVSALLFYFGYVSARAQFRYFGVDVDTLGFSTQEFVMRAPQPLLVPALVLLLVTAGLTWANGLARRRLGSATPGASGRAGRALVRAGAVLTASGTALLLGYGWVGGWDPYPLVTPVVLGLGGGLLALALGWSGGRSRSRRTTAVLLVAVVVSSVFWTTATLAQWSGTGAAKALARDLTTLPAVVLDTTDPLFPNDDVVVESVFPEGTEQTYGYRYRGLRLLAEGEGRLFLVPERWSPSGSTFVVSMDEVRVRFRFVDDPP